MAQKRRNLSIRKIYDEGERQAKAALKLRLANDMAKTSGGLKQNSGNVIQNTMRDTQERWGSSTAPSRPAVSAPSRTPSASKTPTRTEPVTQDRNQRPTNNASSTGHDGRSALAALARRMGDTATGAAKSYASGMVSDAAVPLMVARNVTQNATNTVSDWISSDYATAQRDLAMMVEDNRLNPGTWSEADIRTQRSMVDALSSQSGALSRATRVDGNDGINAVHNLADRLSYSAQEDIERAKDGLGTVGQFAVDVGVGGLQLAGDIALGGLTGLGAMPVLGARSFGGGMQQARLDGASESEQLAYGTMRTALSLGIEKLTSANVVLKSKFGQGFADGLMDRLTEKVVGRINSEGGKAAARTLMQIGESFVSEGAEEAVESVLEPFIQRATYDPDAALAQASDVLYDFLVGGAIGGITGIGDVMYRDFVGNSPEQHPVMPPLTEDITPNWETRYITEPAPTNQTNTSDTPAPVRPDGFDNLRMLAESMAQETSRVETPVENVESEPLSVKQEAGGVKSDVLRRALRGTVTNRTAETVLNDKDALRELEYLVGTSMTEGSKSQRRGLIKMALEDVRNGRLINQEPERDVQQTENVRGSEANTDSITERNSTSYEEMQTPDPSTWPEKVVAEPDFQPVNELGYDTTQDDMPPDISPDLPDFSVQSADIQRDTVERYAKVLGKAGGSAIQTLYDGEEQAEPYILDFTRWYNAGKNGATLDSLGESDFLTPPQMQGAYLAGQADGNSIGKPVENPAPQAYTETTNNEEAVTHGEQLDTEEPSVEGVYNQRGVLESEQSGEAAHRALERGETGDVQRAERERGADAPAEVLEQGTGDAGSGPDPERDAAHRGEAHDGENRSDGDVSSQETPEQAIQREVERRREAAEPSFKLDGITTPNTPKARYRANVTAIRTLRSLADSGRTATKEEKETLAAFTGWGGLDKAFDPAGKWGKEYEELKGLLTLDEYSKAKSSILDAYYTDTDIVRGMYDGLSAMGLKGGTVLEPSAGIGRFIGGAPASFHMNGVTAVELDSVTGSMAKYIYPDKNILVQGFETAKLADNSFDLVIGNVPFGEVGVYDGAYPKHITAKIHNYFIAKSIDKVRPGGIVAVITTSGTMDAGGDQHRRWFAEKADLLGAVRLPNTAFKGTGTGVISDILVFQKRAEGAVYGGGSFISAKDGINEYFSNHPEMILGTARTAGGRFGAKTTYDPIPGKPLGEQIAEAMGKLQLREVQEESVSYSSDFARRLVGYRLRGGGVPDEETILSRINTLEDTWEVDLSDVAATLPDALEILVDPSVHPDEAVENFLYVSGFLGAEALENAVAYEDNSEYNENNKEIRDFVRQHHFVVTDELTSNIADFGDWRKRNMGKFILHKGEMQNIDTVYQSLHGAYPGVFKKIDANTATQLIDIAESLDDLLIKKGRAYNPYANDIQGAADALSEQILDAFLQEETQETAEKRVGAKIERKNSSPKKSGGIKAVKDSVEDLNRAKSKGDKKKIKEAEKKLEETYDQFVEENGRLTDQKNVDAVLTDEDALTLAALETENEAGEIVKSEVFDETPVEQVFPERHADTVEDALIITLNERPYVDIDRIASIMGKDKDTVLKELLDRELVYRTPEGGLVEAERYLSGDVRAKWKAAKEAAETDKGFERNVKALERVVPAYIEPQDIKVGMGSTWVPDEVYSQFAAHMLGMQNTFWSPRLGEDVVSIGIRYNKSAGSYGITVNTKYVNDQKNFTQWGSQGRPFVSDSDKSLLYAALNNKTIRIYKQKDGGLDKDKTDVANKKLEEIKQEFQRWLWSDKKRCEELGELYNDLFNSYATPKYDGSKLTLNGLKDGFVPRSHQLDAIQRIISGNGNTLLAHRVGAGKTFEMAAAAMKLRELGIVKKPMFVVPKNIVAQWDKEFHDYFPNAKVLYPAKGEFIPFKRKAFLGKVASGDYDAIIVSVENFKAIPMSAEERTKFYQDQLDLVENELTALGVNKDDGGNKKSKSMSVRQIENTKATLKVKLQKLVEKIEKEASGFSFEELGVDSLFIDEAHQYKNLFYHTKTADVADLGDSKGSERSADLYMKVRYLQRLNGGKGVVFATATPIMNSVVEMYTMQRYLQGDLLESRGIAHFDAWANQFGQVDQILKMKPDGNGFQTKSSMDKYKNLTELQQMFRSFADVIVDVSELPYLKIPKMKGGGRIVVECEASEFQREFMNALGERSKRLGRYTGDKDADHIFKIMDDGKKIAYTQRMIDPTLPYEEGGKLYSCAQRVFDVWQRTADNKGTQLIFCDRGVPKTGKESTDGIDLYADLKAELVRRGIPAEEIAFIHDYSDDEKKAALFKKVNDGEVRVLLGSSAKMGVGMNVQKRVAALHELNPPPRPGDLEQNEGRALRQGNMYDEVEVYTYVTKYTFDAKLWDDLKRKATFIHQVMTNAQGSREAESGGELTASAAEISAIASGNPLIFERFKVSEKIAELERLSHAHDRQVFSARAQAEEFRKKLPVLRANLEVIKADAAKVQDMSGDKFRMVIGKRTYDKRKDAGAAIVKKAKSIYEPDARTEVVTEIGSFGGFKLALTNRGEALLIGDSRYRTERMDFSKPEGCVKRISNLLSSIPDRVKLTQENIRQTEQGIEALDEVGASIFEQSGELAELRVRENQILLELEEAEKSPKPKKKSGQKKNDGVSGFKGNKANKANPGAGREDMWRSSRIADGKSEVRPLTEIVNQLAHDFDLNLTKGHMKLRGADGEYHYGRRGVRLKGANDLPVFCHEIGHYLDDHNGILHDLETGQEKPLTSAVRQQLKAALGVTASNYKADEVNSEGLAEYIRQYLQNRDDAAADYPDLTDYVRKSISDKDLALLDNAADMVNAYFAVNEATATDNIKLHEEDVYRADTVMERIKNFSDGVYQMFVDSLNGVKKMDDTIGSDTYTYASNAAYSDAIAANAIMFELRDVNGQYVNGGIKEVMQGVDLKNKKEYMEFGEYLVVRHGPERLRQGQQVFSSPVKNTERWMKRRAAELEKQYPAFEEAAKRLTKFNRDLLRVWGVETGLVSQEDFDMLEKLYPTYVPFNRAINSTGRGVGAKRGMADQHSPVNRAKGSGLDILHPLDNTVYNIVRTINAGKRNHAMQKIADAADQYGAEFGIMEPIPTPKVLSGEFDMTDKKERLLAFLDELNLSGSLTQDALIKARSIVEKDLDGVIKQFSDKRPSGNIITVMKGGKAEYWKINDPALLKSVTSMDDAKLDGVLGAIGAVHRIFTANTTGNNLIWSLFSNAPRDLMTFYMYSKDRNLAKVVKNLGSAYIARAKGESAEPLYREYLGMGGGKTSAYTADSKLAKRARDKTVFKKASLNPLDYILLVSDIVEDGPRYATYKMLRQKGVDPHKAFYEAQDITVNFRRHGTRGKQLNALIPFFNASVQGLDKFSRFMSAKDIPVADRPKVIRTRAMVYVAASAMLAAMSYALNGWDEEKRRDYETLSTYTKNSYWCIPLGDGKYFAIPKPRELAVMTSFFEALMEKANGNDSAFYEMGAYAASSLLPPVASELAQGDLSGMAGSFGVLGELYYLGANVDFLGRPIESAGLQNKEPKDRYNERTSMLAREIGRAFNASPQKLDHLFGFLLGGWWKTQKALFPVGRENVDWTLGIQNSYLKDNQYSQDTVNRIYDMAEKSEWAKNSDSGNRTKEFWYLMDKNLTDFWSEYSGCDESSGEVGRSTRGLALSTLYEYLKARESGTVTEANKLVLEVFQNADSTNDLLPAALKHKFKAYLVGEDGKKTNVDITLSDAQYVEMQMEYLTLYWGYAEQLLPGAANKEATLRALRATAENEAKENALKRIGSKATMNKTAQKSGVGGQNATVFDAAVSEANSDGSVTKDEVLDILAVMVKDGLDEYDAHQLYMSRGYAEYDSPYWYYPKKK